MIVLCTLHKGGVGKTELAIHVAGALRTQVARTLLVDCDSQASAWEFHFGTSPTAANEARPVDDRLSVLWNPDRVRIKGQAADYDHFVLDLDSPLENTVQTIVQDSPDLVLIPVTRQHGALSKLKDPLAIVAQLKAKAGHGPCVRIVPLGAKNRGHPQRA